jgi:hypothetical protein
MVTAVEANFWAALIGSSAIVFVVMSLLAVGLAWLTGVNLGAQWRPLRLVFIYCALLTFGHRFLLFALRDAALLSPLAFLLEFTLFAGVGGAAFYLSRQMRLVQQYPWLYERRGLFRATERKSALHL